MERQHTQSSLHSVMGKQHRSVQLISKTRSWQPHYAPPLGNIGTEMPAGEGLHRRWLSDLLIVLHPQVLLGTAYCKHAKHLSLRLGQMLLKSYMATLPLCWAHSCHTCHDQLPCCSWPHTLVPRTRHLCVQVPAATVCFSGRCG